jgi:hypothetical protein
VRFPGRRGLRDGVVTTITITQLIVFVQDTQPVAGKERSGESLTHGFHNVDPSRDLGEPVTSESRISRFGRAGQRIWVVTFGGVVLILWKTPDFPMVPPLRATNSDLRGRGTSPSAGETPDQRCHPPLS